ncbi:ADP-ribosylglycohydrolase family protein [Chondrinema litorale]|uniref:ADP-ribosylglycohydrolase family protein n=1 Tax=Chondrinema litorale TaxID=2994555 RepID=UPI002543E007|nr:ADP-ribosylglycohydrolase family protein [Chondrinema litorale]UZR95343.1 ADP-ribosylglycohydrolase family protein [Chondrinema litorale]
MRGKAKDILLGVAVGDALGVPYEFKSREALRKLPVRDMIGYMTHNQPAGTWSDDSSLTFCLAEAIADGYTLKTAAFNFIKWKNEAYWTARNKIFDIGLTTAKAITDLARILSIEDLEALETLKYASTEYDNGNGSLMRILPLIYVIKGKDIKMQFEIVWNCSALTHRHIRAGMCCMIYLKLAEYLINGLHKIIAYEKTREDIQELWRLIDFDSTEQKHFQRVIQEDIREVSENLILSGGYVIESLEASLWCFLLEDSFQETVLKAINFGHDTDTTGAITGGLAGIYYGYESIPEYWIASLARFEDILELGNKLDKYDG